jgi:hypothetical protein
MLASAGHNNTLKPAEETFWLGGFGGTFAASFIESPLYTPPVPNSDIAIEVVSDPATNSVGVGVRDGGKLGTLTTQSGTGLLTGTFTDTFSNNAKISISADSTGHVNASVTIPLD